MDADFKGIRIKKRWGYELELFNNGIISCWFLHINEGHETSLHMHANKRTSMVLIRGTCRLSYLNDSKAIYALDKTNFGPRFFHRHTAITDSDLIEVEPANSKLDLHRFKDAYGREGQPYEGPENYEPLTSKDPQLDRYGAMTLGDALVTVRQFNARTFREWAQTLKERSAVVFLKGSLRSPQGVEVVVPGHVVWSSNLPDLLETTAPDNEIEVMQIWRTKSSTI